MPSLADLLTQTVSTLNHPRAMVGKAPARRPLLEELQSLLPAAEMGLMMTDAGDMVDLFEGSKRLSQGVRELKPRPALEGMSQLLTGAAGAAIPFLSLGGVIRAFHGTDRAFDAFDTRRAGQGMDVGDGKGAVFATDDPTVAETYLGGAFVNRRNPQLRDAGGVPISDDVARHFSPGSNIRPLDIDDDDFIVWDMGGGGFSNSFVNDAIAEARKEGAPGVVFENVRDSGVMGLGQGKKSNVWAVIDTKRIRSGFGPKPDEDLIDIVGKDGKRIGQPFTRDVIARDATGRPLQSEPLGDTDALLRAYGIRGQHFDRNARAAAQGFEKDAYHFTPYEFDPDEFAVKPWRGGVYVSKSGPGAQRGHSAGAGDRIVSGSAVKGAKRGGFRVMPLKVRGQVLGEDPLPAEWFPENITYGEYRAVYAGDAKFPPIEGLSEKEMQVVDAWRRNVLIEAYDEGVPRSEWHKYTTPDGDTAPDFPMKRRPQSEMPTGPAFGYDAIEGFDYDPWAHNPVLTREEKRALIKKLGFSGVAVNDEAGSGINRSMMIFDPADIKSRFDMFEDIVGKK